MSGRKKFKSKIGKVKATVESLGYEVSVKPTKRARHATEIVKEACYEKIDMLLVSGGDGTMNECVNGLATSRHKPKIAYIPSGTACDIAKTLGIPKNVDKALKIIRDDHHVMMDIVKGSHGHFVYVTAIGNYVDISYVTQSRLKRIFGYGAYLFTGLREFFTIPMIKTEITHDEGNIKGYFSLIMAVNSRRVASFNIIRDPVLDDGKIDVIVYRYIPLLNNLIYLVSFIFAPNKFPGITRIKTARAKIYTEHHHKWNIDGEAANAGNQEISVIPKFLNIIINQRKAGSFFPNQ